MKSLLGGFWRAIFLSLLFINPATQAAVPVSPTGLRGAWVNNASSLLTWETSPDADSFKIFRFDTNAQTWLLIASDVGVPMFREGPGMEPPLQYAVSAVNADGESDAAIVTIENSGWSGTTIMYYDPSYYPGLLTRTSVTLMFAVSPVDGTDALLEFSDVDFPLDFMEYRPNYSGFHTFTITDLTPATRYFFRVTFNDVNRLGLSYNSYFSTLPLNSPPQVFDINAQVDEDYGPIWIQPVYSDPDNYETPTFRVVTQPTNGTVIWDGYTFMYMPNVNFFGTDTFTYAASDIEEEGAPATVTITVNSVNDIGIFDNPTQSITILEDEVATGSFSVSDIEGDQHTLVVAFPPDAGTVEIDGTNFTFTAGANVNGPFSIGFSAIDHNGIPAEATAWVIIDVTSVNDVPVAQNLEFTILEDSGRGIELQGSDIETTGLLYVIVDGPLNGTLGGSGQNISYTANPNFNGTDRIRYKVLDGTTESAVAEVTITVLPIDDLPVAVPQNISTAEDQSIPVTLTATDIDGGSIFWRIGTLPANGTLSGEAPNLVYTPNPNFHGNDSFTFRADFSTATVSIQVTPVNDAPVANNSNVTTSYNNPVAINLTGSDIDSAGLTFNVDTLPANGTLSGAAPNFYFIPNVSWVGTTSFTFHATDGQANSAAATVTITVQPTTTVPGMPLNLTAQAISTSQINLTWNDNSNNEDGFVIERANGSNWTQVGSVGPSYGPYTVTFSNTGLQSNKTYTYRVRAFNVIGNSAYSNTASAKTLR